MSKITITDHSITKGTEYIPFSRYITLEESENSIKISIKRPYENMQKDAACFEGVALILKIIGGFKEITVSFDEVNWNGSFNNLTPDQCHYMRFLYRISKFSTAFDWFKIDPANKQIVASFINKIRKDLVCNIPSSDSTYNPNKGIEHQIEKYFCDATKKRTYFLSLFEKATQTELCCIHDQYPNGLFIKNVGRETRIFPTGYFDLWGISDKNELCIFELKKQGNLALGILSELIFYATYAQDFLVTKKCIPLEKNNEFRGYNDLTSAINNNCKKVNAYFLTDDLYKAIGNHIAEIESLLNVINPSITFKFISYKQNEVLG